MAEPGKCPHCGALLDDREAQCPFCRSGEKARLGIRQESLLLLFLGLLAVIFFALTSFFASAFHRHQDHLGRMWFARGESDLVAGRPLQAIDDFRNALQFARGDPRYRLRLVDALLAANRQDEARAYLLTLWDQQPASGVVNLQLARLAAARGDRSEAVRYFNNAIYGVWEKDPMGQRLAVRLEFAQFLVRQHDYSNAQADLIIAAGNAPPDPGLLVRIGRLFLQASNPTRALEQFHRALQIDSKSAAAAAGAGQAAFQNGDYRDAQRHLQLALSLEPGDAATSALLETTNLILDVDPLAPRLRSRQQAERAWRGYQQALKRLQACAQQLGEPLEVAQPGTDLQLLAARARKLTPQPSARRLLQDPDLRDATVEMMFQIERVTAVRCGPPVGIDLALFELARRQQEASQ